jgi:two-component system LytT family response regulator
MKLRVMLADSDQLALHKLAKLLEREPDAAIVAQAVDAQSAQRAIVRAAPDALFVDVDFDGLTSLLGVAGAGQTVERVLLAGGADAALRALRADATAYLAKPLQESQVSEAWRRVRERLRAPARSQSLRYVNTLLKDWAEARSRRARSPLPLLVPQGDRSLLLQPEQVDWLEADGKYVNLHVGKQVFVIRHTLARLEMALDSRRFVRIHRSAIVQLNRLSELRPLRYGDLEALLRNGTKLNVSRYYADRLSHLLAMAL